MDADIELRPKAWERTSGSPAVRVAVVDSGINFAEPDLVAEHRDQPGGAPAAAASANDVDDDGNGFVDDWRGWDFVQQGQQRVGQPRARYAASPGSSAARGNNGIGVGRRGVALVAHLRARARQL